MTYKGSTQVLLFVVVLAVTGSVTAQDNPPGEMPTITGKGKITEAVDTKVGAIFDIGIGITMTLPRGLPIGSSRVLTLEKAKNKPQPAQIDKHFQKYGETVGFSGTLNTAGKPILVILSVKKDPYKRGQKFVLAVEEAGLCTAENKKYSIGKGLCSVWRTVDTQYDASSGRVIAKLKATGGHRMQFGWIPESTK
jgi:hypothetical protein